MINLPDTSPYVEDDEKLFESLNIILKNKFENFTPEEIAELNKIKDEFLSRTIFYVCVTNKASAQVFYKRHTELLEHIGTVKELYESNYGDNIVTLLGQLETSIQQLVFAFDQLEPVENSKISITIFTKKHPLYNLVGYVDLFAIKFRSGLLIANSQDIVPVFKTLTYNDDVGLFFTNYMLPRFKLTIQELVQDRVELMNKLEFNCFVSRVSIVAQFFSHFFDKLQENHLSAFDIIMTGFSFFYYMNERLINDSVEMRCFTEAIPGVLDLEIKLISALLKNPAYIYTYRYLVDKRLIDTRKGIANLRSLPANNPEIGDRILDFLDAINISSNSVPEIRQRINIYELFASTLPLTFPAHASGLLKLRLFYDNNKVCWLFFIPLCGKNHMVSLLLTLASVKFTESIDNNGTIFYAIPLKSNSHLSFKNYINIAKTYIMTVRSNPQIEAVPDTSSSSSNVPVSGIEAVATSSYKEESSKKQHGNPQIEAVSDTSSSSSNVPVYRTEAVATSSYYLPTQAEGGYYGRGNFEATMRKPKRWHTSSQPQQVDVTPVKSVESPINKYPYLTFVLPDEMESKLERINRTMCARMKQIINEKIFAPDNRSAGIKEVKENEQKQIHATSQYTFKVKVKGKDMNKYRLYGQQIGNKVFFNWLNSHR